MQKGSSEQERESKSEVQRAGAVTSPLQHGLGLAGEKDERLVTRNWNYLDINWIEARIKSIE